MKTSRRISDFAALNIRILYLEDDERLASSMQKIMQNLSIHTTHLSDPLEALKVASEEMFDIILSDVKMPNMDGITFAKKLREADNNTPIIIMSGYQETDDLHRAIPLHLTDYLIKPVPLDKLLEAFEKALSSSKKNNGIHLHQHTYYDNTSKAVFHHDSGELIPLGRREWVLLELLLTNRNRYVTTETIENMVYDGALSESSLRNTILRLREKIKSKSLIKNYRELGYMLK